MKKFIMLSFVMLLVGSMGFGALAPVYVTATTPKIAVALNMLKSDTYMSFKPSTIAVASGTSLSQYSSQYSMHNVSFTCKGVKFTTTIPSGWLNGELRFKLSSLGGSGYQFSGSPSLEFTDIQILPAKVAANPVKNYRITTTTYSTINPVVLLLSL